MDAQKTSTSVASPKQANPDVSMGDVIATFIDVDELTEPLSKEEDRRIARRIDLYLIPVLAFTYMLQFLDKQAMPLSAILGLQTDLKLQGQDYSWASSIFYFGYLVSSYPTSILMVKFPLGKVLSISVILWAIVLMAMAACKNAAGLQAARFCLGVVEAGISPGFGMITVMWFKRQEQSMRLGAWFLGNVCANLFGSLLFYGMGHITSFSSWRAGFLIVGGFTLLWGVGLLYLLPDTPMNAWFLNEEDRKKAIRRVQSNQTGFKSNKFKIDQAVDCLRDPICWLLFLIHTAGAIPNGGVTNFSTIIIKGLGFSSFQTLLVNMIIPAFGIVFVCLGMISTTYLPNFRIYAVCLYSLLSIVGAVMVVTIDESHVWARFFGCCLMTAFIGNFAILLLLSTANVAGFTRKSTLNSISFIGYCVGNIVGPQMFLAHEAPKYRSGFIGMMICWGVLILSALCLRFYFVYENKRRDAIQSSSEDPEAFEGGSQAFTDATDREMVRFRYVY